MEPKVFISKLDDAKIVAAIAAAEQRTSGEIRICISSRNRTDALAAAKERFEKLGMTNTRERNGTLIFFAPKSRQFAIIGDFGIHAKCGDGFWNSISSQMHEHLQAGHFTDAVLYAIEKVGEALAAHFPRRPDDANELPDDIIGD